MLLHAGAFWKFLDTVLEAFNFFRLLHENLEGFWTV